MTKKVVFVTGGATGIGKSLAIEFAKEGYDVAFSYRSNEAKANAVLEEIKNHDAKAVAIKADLREFSQISNMFCELQKHFERLDVFVNNAGITITSPFLETTEETFDCVCDVDFKGAYFCIQHAAKLMIEKDIKGSIVLISSNNAFTHFGNVSAYAPVKMAATKFAEHAAIELAKYGIRVNTIAPGWTDTGAERLGNPADTYYKIPLKKWVNPKEIADTAMFLSSPAAASITGATILMDNGATLVCDKREKYGF